MATLADIVEHVRDTVYGMRKDLRPRKDRLDGAINDSVTAVDFETPAMWKRGDKAEFQDNGEIVELRADLTGASVEVFERGADGTTAASHDDHTIVLHDPRLSLKKIERAINNAIDNDLWPHVWIRTERTVSGYDDEVEVYELAAGDVDVEQMYQYDVDSDDKWREIPNAYYSVINSVASAVPTGATSGKALVIRRVIDADETVYYTAKTKPSSSSISDLDSALVEMAAIRASATLMAQAPVERRQRQTGRTRRQDQATDYGTLMAEFIRLRDQYATRLRVELLQKKKYQPSSPRSPAWMYGR